MKIEIIKIKSPKFKPDFKDLKSLGFGKHFSDHMFTMDYSKEKSWHNAKIIPYGKLEFEPSMSVFHYGQTSWEGLKAYKDKNNEISLFRPSKNFERLNNSSKRMNIPEIDEEFCLEVLKTLLSLDKDWIPNEPNTSLYIRPMMIATEAAIGLHPSNTYKFIIICSPSGVYCDLNPTKIIVEEKYVRAVPGGTGFAKTSGNYAASIKAQVEAIEKGYFQNLWLDGIERKYVEEVGSMNIFFKINGEVVTPMLNGSILSGITRLSVIELLKDWKISISERRISIDEVYDCHKNGTLEEIFGTGTAAVISPIGELSWRDEKIVINDNKIGDLTKKIYDEITGIQFGKIEDRFSWTYKVQTNNL